MGASLSTLGVNDCEPRRAAASNLKIKSGEGVSLVALVALASSGHRNSSSAVSNGPRLKGSIRRSLSVMLKHFSVAEFVMPKTSAPATFDISPVAENAWRLTSPAFSFSSKRRLYQLGKRLQICYQR